MSAGREWFRISKHPFKPEQFNFTKADNPYRGGRFDSVAGDYGYTYLASTLGAAVDEALLRDAPFNDAGGRVLPSATLTDKYYVSIEIVEDLELLNLITVEALSEVGQSYWLTDCEAYDYARTRFWAQTLRRWAEDAAGFVWRPRHNHEELAIVLFKDTSPATPRPDPELATRAPLVSISSGSGRDEVANILAKRNVWLT